MARKPHPMHRQTGDQGQQYVVRALGYPREGANDIGYCKELKSATMMLQGIQMVPSAVSVWIIDREENQLVRWDGNPEDHVMDLTYECPECGKETHDQWSCAVDNECSHCGTRNLSAIKAEDNPNCTCLMCQTRKEYP